jgi:hypothetical protein
VKEKTKPLLSSGIIKAMGFPLLLLLLWPVTSYAQFSFQDQPLKEVIRTIEAETNYFFLYRESQIAGIRITLESVEEQIFDDLKADLVRHDIALRVNHQRNQVLLTRAETAAAETPVSSIQGQILDASSGERLPFATIIWYDDEQLNGVAANASGHFLIQNRFEEASVTLAASYVGYKKRTVEIELPASNQIDDLTIRLEPEQISGNEIIVSGFSGHTPSDTLLTGMIDAARFSPLGESNAIRALQSHPSVSKGTALNNGINVRGSTPDGFLVMLDGMSIFNQSHVFGLLDSFNSDAITSAGYYFGVVPAHIDTPTGGTLNLITRTGSRNEFRNRIGLSNTTLNGTFEGPLGSRSSWLLSARTSYMDKLSWFNNPDLIQWGLDIDRRKRIASDEPDYTALVLQPGDASARFVDVHGKVYHETAGSGQLILSGYFGGDQTSQKGQRRTRSAGSGGAFVFEEVETSNEWGNGLLSLQYMHPLTDRLYSSTTAGLSLYKTEFEKDDFVYSRVSSEAGNDIVTIFTYPFRNQSAINEFKLNQDFEYQLPRFDLRFGGSWKYYHGEYSESSFDRPSFNSESEAHIADVYVQHDWNPFRILELNTGLRAYYFSPGRRVLLAPRAQMRISPSSRIAVFGGYAVNHQFLHRVSLENATTADVWILSTSEQPPASSRQYSAGVEIMPLPAVYLKMEAYQKSYSDLRIHELNSRSLENTFAGTPWFFENEGSARGVELILRNRLSRFTLTQSYTLSRMEFENEALLDGESFPADWDRTHAYTAVIETGLTNQLQINLSWTMMSGAPNALATFGNDRRQRLDAYYRLDSSLEYQQKLGEQSRLEFSFSIFNLLNRDNTWYRTYSFSFDETRSIPRLRPVPVDVLDLGIQPSFSLKYVF